MSETNTSGLRQLAHRYYTGELSYEAYRSERSSLLDQLTQQSAYEMVTSKTKPVLEKTRVMPVTSRRHSRVWFLIMIVILTAVLVWLLHSGRVTLSLAAVKPAVAPTSLPASTIGAPTSKVSR